MPARFRAPTEAPVCPLMAEAIFAPPLYWGALRQVRLRRSSLRKESSSNRREQRRRSFFQFTSVFSVTSCKKLFFSRLRLGALCAFARDWSSPRSQFMVPHLTRPCLSCKGILLNIGENFSRQEYLSQRPGAAALQPKQRPRIEDGGSRIANRVEER
jgi:hypothetical protein